MSACARPFETSVSRSSSAANAGASTVSHIAARVEASTMRTSQRLLPKGTPSVVNVAEMVGITEIRIALVA
jgi:hypothetical protein